MTEPTEKEIPSGLPSGLGDTLSKLLSDPDLVARIRAVAGGDAGAAEDPRPTDNAPDTPALDPEILKKLPGVLSAMAPLTGGKAPSPADDRRSALLLALKPFLSPARCQAVDSILQISRLGDLLGGIK